MLDVRDSISARGAALKTLIAFRRENAWPDLALGGLIDRHMMPAREAALAMRITNGVMQNLILCDYYIAHFSSIEFKKIEPRILDILRLSVYQLVFMNKIPHSAAVNEGVALVGKKANPRAAGFVNAVLRSIARAVESNMLPKIKGEFVQCLSIKYSHPEWLVRKLCEIMDNEAVEAFLIANNDAYLPVTAQINTLLTDGDNVLASLIADDVETKRHEWLDGCIELRGAHSIARLNAFQKGLIYIQDAAARLAVMATEPKPGDFIIDGCAAPGGKSFAAAIAMGNKGKIIACDVNETKLQRLVENAERLGISIIDTFCSDILATTTENRDTPQDSGVSDKYIGSADIVFADVPCSGFGVIRKKPEIRYKTERDIAGLPDVQKKILSALSTCVKPGGILLYSTCTIFHNENEDVVESFLSNNKQFAAESFSLPGIGHIQNGMTTLWPHTQGTDGFFICKLRRKL